MEVRGCFHFHYPRTSDVLKSIVRLANRFLGAMSFLHIAPEQELCKLSKCMWSNLMLPPPC